MTIKLDEKDSVVCLWMADDIDGDSLMVILQERENSYTLNARLRKRVDDKVFDSEDKKTFYRLLFKPGVTKETALELCDAFWDAAGEKYCMRSIRQLIGGGIREFQTALRKYDSFHERKMPVDSDS